MKSSFLILSLLVLAGCVSSVCPERLNLTGDWLLSYEQRPDTQYMDRVFDRSVSVGGDVYTLKAYDAGTGFYYVQYNPVRSATQTWYGPYPGDFREDTACP